jgi:hypothetical protein
MDEQRRPRRRDQGLTVESIGDELLVFDQLSQRAHSLNKTAADVWQACDGTRSPEQLAEHCQLDPLAVDLALGNLTDSDLLTEPAATGERVSRRTAIRRMAITGAGIGVALPVIRSIVAPSAAMATSGASCDGANTCGPTSYCSYSSTCHPGHSASHGPGHPCQGISQCSFNAVCSSGACLRI